MCYFNPYNHLPFVWLVATKSTFKKTSTREEICILLVLTVDNVKRQSDKYLMIVLFNKTVSLITAASTDRLKFSIGR